jgi:DNA polymerase
VGEAPGAQEDKLGKPFVGGAGKTLNRMLRRAGIRRSRCLVINPFFTRPPNNNVGHFFLPREMYRKVKPEFRRHIKHFHKILDSHRPAMIIAMGRTASWALTNYRGELSSRIGKISHTEYGPMIQINHPAYFMRGKQDEIKKQIPHLKLARLIAERIVI